MSAIPEWVQRYKTKGVYTKKLKAGYALYRGHSERVPGKPYPRFLCDEYLGIVTERDGLKSPRPPVRPGIRVLRYGFFVMAESACRGLREVPAKCGVPERAVLLYARAVLANEGRAGLHGYQGSWYSNQHPGLEIGSPLTQQEDAVLARMTRQAGSKLTALYGNDYEEMLILSEDVYAVHVNGSWHISQVSQRLEALGRKHGISFKLQED